MAEIKNLLLDDLRKATSELETVNPWLGLLRCFSIAFILLSIITYAWFQSEVLYFSLLIFIAGWFYSLLLICTHDGVHYTLIGWPWLEEILSRLITWPILWPHGAYSELHRLHHGWNGYDLRDPERVQPTRVEYEKASPLVRWYYRHQWMVDIFVFGSWGLIIKSFIKAWNYQSLLPKLRSLFILDISGMISIHASLAYLAFAYHQLPRYLLFWFIIERTTGAIMQTRDHLEHYGLWGSSATHQLTQLYSSRNVGGNFFTTLLAGGLNYHCVHHAFPNIPYHHMKEAFARIQAVLKEHDQSLVLSGEGYFKETFKLINKFSLIEIPEVTEK